MIKISVVITEISGNEKQLGRTLQSVLEQSLTEVEIICICRRSESDGISYYCKDDRIRFADSLEDAIALVKGEYLHIIKASDEVLEYAYDSIYNKAVKYNLDCLKFMVQPVDAGTGETVKLKSLALANVGEGHFLRLFDKEKEDFVYRTKPELRTCIFRTKIFREIVEEIPKTCFEPFLYMKALLCADRIMASRDRVLLADINISDRGIDTDKAKSWIEDAKNMEKWLEERCSSEHLAETVMQRLYYTLYEECQYQPENAILRDVADVLGRYAETAGLSYQSVFIRRLRAIQLLAKDSERAIPKPKQKRFFYEDCVNPKVSVIVPVYNQEDFLNTALYSLVEQTLKEVEFICVNDGSKDSSMTILKQYAAVDKRIHIIDKVNTGYGNSMNVGIDGARGEYLAILEPDDFIPADMLEHLYDAAHANQLDFVKADFYRFTVDKCGEIIKNHVKLSSNPKDYNRVINPVKEQKTFTFVMNTWSGIYRMSFLRENNIRHNETPGASFQDNGFWFQTFTYAKRAMFMDIPFYMNRRDNPNSSIYDPQKVYCMTNEYKYIWDKLGQTPGYQEELANTFYCKKFEQFVMTYRRIADSVKPEYLRHTHDEFEAPVRSGVFNPEVMSEYLQMMFHKMMDCPDTLIEETNLSVVVVTQNSADVIERCLENLLIRNEIKTEIICVDRESEDRTLNIIKNVAMDDNRVKLISAGNVTEGAASNIGLETSVGEYVAFLRPEDTFEPDMLRIVYNSAAVRNADVLVYRCDEYLDETNEYFPLNGQIVTALLPGKDVFAGSEIVRDIFNCFTPGIHDKLFRRKFIIDKGVRFNDNTSKGVGFAFSLLALSDRIALKLGRPVAHWDAAGNTANIEGNIYDELEQFKKRLSEQNIWDRCERDYVNFAIPYIGRKLLSCDYNDALDILDRIKNEGLEKLGIAEVPESYFYSVDRYDALRMLLDAEPGEIMHSIARSCSAENKTAERQLSEYKKETEENNFLKKKAENKARWIKREMRSLNNAANQADAKAGGAGKRIVMHLRKMWKS